MINNTTAGAHERRRCLDTLEQNRKHQVSYLKAVIDHHSRVAAIAMQMTKLGPPHLWCAATRGLAVEMAKEIEKSHIRAFGISTQGLIPGQPDSPAKVSRDLCESYFAAMGVPPQVINPEQKDE